MVSHKARSFVHALIPVANAPLSTTPLPKFSIAFFIFCPLLGPADEVFPFYIDGFPVDCECERDLFLEQFARLVAALYCHCVLCLVCYLAFYAFHALVLRSRNRGFEAYDLVLDEVFCRESRFHALALIVLSGKPSSTRYCLTLLAWLPWSSIVPFLTVPPHASFDLRCFTTSFMSMLLSVIHSTSVIILPNLRFMVLTVICCSPLAIISQMHRSFGKPHFGQTSVIAYLLFPPSQFYLVF